jgi:hypothetical protein
LNSLDILGEDLQNTYLNAPVCKKYIQHVVHSLASL